MCVYWVVRQKCVYWVVRQIVCMCVYCVVRQIVCMCVVSEKLAHFCRN